MTELSNISITKKISEISRSRYFENEIIYFIENYGKDFNNNNFIICLYYIGKYGGYNFFTRHKDIIDFILDNIDIEILNCQNISSIIFSLAKLKYKDKYLIRKLVKDFINKSNYFNNKDISRFMWSLVNLEYPVKDNEECIKKLIEIFMNKSSSFNNDNIANFIWCLAKFEYKDENCIKKLIDEFMNRNSSFNDKNVSNFIWSLAKFNYTDENCIKRLIEIFTLNSDKYTSQGVSNIIWSLATLEYSVRDDVEKCIKKAIEIFNVKHKQFNIQEINNFIWSLVSFNYYDENVINILIKEFKTRDFPKEEINLFIWCIAIFDRNVDFVIENYYNLDKNGTDFVEIYLYLKYYKMVDVPYEKLYINQTKPIISKLQEDIYKYFDDKKYVMEYKLYCFSIDIADPNEKIAIEVNGPYHYINNELKLKDQLRYKIIRSLGWKVYIIDYKVWKDLEDKKDYIKILIK